MRLSPSSTLSTVAAIYLAALLFLILTGLQERVTGLDWHSDNEFVYFQGEAGSYSFPQPVAVKTLKTAGQTYSLNISDVIPEPDVLPRFAETREFFQRQGELTLLLQAPSVTVETVTGASYNLLLRDKHFSDFSLSFWLISLAGFFGLLVTAGVWSYKPNLMSARIFLVCGIGYAMLSLTLAFYSTREIALPETIFRLSHAGNRLGMVLLTFGGSALLWHYPTQLGKLPFGRLILGVGILCWINESLQWFDTPSHSYFDIFLVCTTASLINGVRQWRRSKDQPLERAALRWLLLSFLISFTLIWLLYVIPILITHSLQLNLVVANWIVLCVFLGIALGISRYRIFDLERWWLSVWLWFINGLLIVGVDLMLISFLDMGIFSSLTLTILLVGWLYFPIRQQVLKRFVGRQAETLPVLLPKILTFMLRQHDMDQAAHFWQQLVNEAMRPIHLEKLNEPIADFSVEDDGMVLRVPAVDDSFGLELAGCDGGRRLFSQKDVDMLRQCHELVCFGEAQYQQTEDAANRERERIMRDLHDDVGAKLLTLIHRVPEPYADMARSALATLRETIFSLNVDNERPLNEFLASLREEYIDRCEAAACELDWQVPDVGHCQVPAHIQINLSRVMRECLTNSLKHASPEKLMVRMAVDDAFNLTIAISHNGECAPVAQWKSNNGILNMHRRMQELAGSLSMDDQSPAGIVMRLNFPIPM